MLQTCVGDHRMSKVDPWGKAAECQRAIEIVADPERRVVLDSLRNLWIALGNAPSSFDRFEQAGQLLTIAQIHNELIAACRSAMHWTACAISGRWLSACSRHQLLSYDPSRSPPVWWVRGSGQARKAELLMTNFPRRAPNRSKRPCRKP